ncbi:MAG: TFIIB-type zinc ribbon-containing protein [Bacteroidota bacterium]
MSCVACGFSDTAGAPEPLVTHPDLPTDDYFGLPLWLQTRCVGHTLWAYHQDHLDLRERHVSAKLRERSRTPGRGWCNASMASRLPTWMTSASNRDAVLRGLRTLRQRAEDYE